jgi:hypothetical protein
MRDVRKNCLPQIIQEELRYVSRLLHCGRVYSEVLQRRVHLTRWPPESGYDGNSVFVRKFLHNTAGHVQLQNVDSIG